jgi:hypothetical protein
MAVWIGSGLYLLFSSAASRSITSGAHDLLGTIILFAAATDIVIGLLLLSAAWISTVSMIQICAIVIYTMVATVFFPDLWLELSMPLARNIPILAATVWLRRLVR